MFAIWNFLFENKNRKGEKKNKSSRSRRLALESLERREMLSVGSLLSSVAEPISDVVVTASASFGVSSTTLSGDYLGWEDDDRIGLRLESTGSDQYKITVYEDGLPGKGHRLNDDDRYEGTATYDASAGVLRISLTKKVDDGRTRSVESVLRNLTATVDDTAGQLRLTIPKNREWDRVTVTQTTTVENVPVTTLTGPVVKAKASKGTVDLSWNAVSGAAYYSVSRLNADGKTWTVLADRVSSTMFADTGLAKGTYTYSVAANGDDGSAATGKSVKAKVTANAVDAPSVKVKASKATVSLSWKAVSEAVSYTVSRLNADGTTWTVLSDHASATNYTDCVTATGTYTYAVKANTAAGLVSGFKSVKAKVKSVGIDAPSVKVKVSEATANLAWKAVAGATHYTVSRLNADGKTWTELSANVTETSFADTDLVNGTHTYAVRAVNANGVLSAFKSVKAKISSGVVIDRILTGDYLGWEGDDRIGIRIGEPVTTGTQVKYSITFFENGLPGNGHRLNDDDRYEGTLTYNTRTGKLQVQLTKKFDDGREKKVESALKKFSGTLGLIEDRLQISFQKNKEWDHVSVTAVS